MVDIRKVLEDPHTVTREDLIRLAFGYWPTGSGPIGMMSIIVGLLQDIATLRGFAPITDEDVRNYDRDSREKRRADAEKRQLDKLQKAREQGQLWLDDKIKFTEERIQKKGVFYVSKRLDKYAGSAPHDIPYGVRNDFRHQFRVKAEEILESYSQRGIK